MQQQPAPPAQVYPQFAYPQPSYPHPTLMCPPPHCTYPTPYYQPWGVPQEYNPYPGTVFNAGGNSNGSGYQKNGDVKVGNHKQRNGGVEIGSIGGNHGNHGGQQVAGDVKVGDIGGGCH